MVRSQIVPLVLAELKLRGQDDVRFAARFDVVVEAPADAHIRLDRLHALLEAAECELGEPELGVHLAERRLAAAKLDLEVHMPHPTPARDTSLRAALGTGRIVYGQPALALRFDSSFLERPLATADAGLHATLLRSAEELVRARRGQRGNASETSLLGSLRRRIEEGLPSGAFDLTTLARTHSMSARTLQRRIKELETTLSMLVNGVREERARSLLTDGTKTVGEVAAALGYFDTAAFVRAFRRWTGTTPTAYRLES